MQISIAEAQKLTSPHPFALLGTCNTQGRANFMALSWWTYASNHPAMLAVCISSKGYTGKLIQETRAFTVNVVGEDMANAAMACGRSTGANTNKVEQFHIPITPSQTVRPPCIPHSLVCFECELETLLPVGDHTLFLGRVTTIKGNPSVKPLYTFDGYNALHVLES